MPPLAGADAVGFLPTSALVSPRTTVHGVYTGHGVALGQLRHQQQQQRCSLCCILVHAFFVGFVFLRCRGNNNDASNSRRGCDLEWSRI
jgi:hypothetical protein